MDTEPVPADKKAGITRATRARNALSDAEATGRTNEPQRMLIGLIPDGGMLGGVDTSYTADRFAQSTMHRAWAAATRGAVLFA